MKRWLIPCITLADSKGPLKAAADGADALMIYDISMDDETHEQVIGLIRSVCASAEIPVIGGGRVRRLEDVKKLIYAGCAYVCTEVTNDEKTALLIEASKRFGKDRMISEVTSADEFADKKEVIENYSSCVLFHNPSPEDIEKIGEISEIPVMVHIEMLEREMLPALLAGKNVSGLISSFLEDTDLFALKEQLIAGGIEMQMDESSVSWSEFKLDPQGLIPVITQDYKTGDVLMLAYMDQEAFEKTVKTGRMHYHSRSRNELWEKGLTSGHFQYVKELRLDCDNDTILAKVDQIGAACHTGSRSCFFQTLLKKEYDDTNPLTVFQDVYDVILDRKEHPKEGSYTNYLFDKGIDKILKKVGEECTEIVIAAKNPDKEEIKYEISDFLYHVMVLMAEKGVTWEDVTSELARR